MTCPSCGSQVDPGDVICPNCLANLTRSSRPAPGPAGRQDATTPAAAPAAAGPGGACPHCGEPVTDAARSVCPNCLLPLGAAATPPAGGREGTEAVSATRREVAASRLRLRFGSAGDVTVARGATVALGRDPAVSPAAATLGRFGNVSRRHARVGMDGDGSAWVEDAGSMNGTFVNGDQLPPATRRRLRDGDELRLASDVVAEVTLLTGEGPG